MDPATVLFWYACGCAVGSVVTFCAYGIDKRAAAKGRRRIPERTLHSLELLCGWPGALLGQQVFRHKTRKVSFKLVLWVIIALHLLGLGWLLWATQG